jgi:hypothetical protein
MTVFILVHTEHLAFKEDMPYIHTRRLPEAYSDSSLVRGKNVWFATFSSIGQPVMIL